MITFKFTYVFKLDYSCEKYIFILTICIKLRLLLSNSIFCCIFLLNKVNMYIFIDFEIKVVLDDKDQR